MTTRHQVLAASILVFGALVAAFGYYHWERSERARLDEGSLAALELEEESPETDRVVQVELFVYRPRADAPGEIRLEPVSREIPVAENDVLAAQQMVNAVIRESPDVLPPLARVRQVYLLDDGTAVVDLSRETAEQLNGGVTSELGVLRAITRSLRQNLPAIDRVRFLVEGEERPTLSGHVSIRQPFM